MKNWSFLLSFFTVRFFSFMCIKQIVSCGMARQIEIGLNLNSFYGFLSRFQSIQNRRVTSERELRNRQLNLSFHFLKAHLNGLIYSD